jgi:hypothetical protein
MHYGCGAALVVATALIVTVVLVIIHWVEGGQQPRQAQNAVPITGSAAVLSDGVTIVYSDPNGLCFMEDLAATETPSRVVLSLSETEGLDGVGCPGFAGPGAASANRPALVGGSAGTTTVTLRSPLGDRRLVDAVTGRTIPCFDQRAALLLPAVAGWSPPGPEDFTTNVPYFGGHGAAVLVERRSGADATSGQPNGMSLMIVQVAGGGWHPPVGTATTHVLVRGLPGLAAPGIIVWSERGHTIAVIGEGQYPAGESAGMQSRPPLPLASLEAIASALTGDRQA